MKRSVYIETTVISYLAAHRSRDLVIAGQQEITEEWWTVRRPTFDAFASQAVIDEASAGDPGAAERRMKYVRELRVAPITDSGRELARRLLSMSVMPPRAVLDALHVAIAASNRIRFLLTWNCAHIANPAIRPLIDRACREQALEPPIICTPYDLLGETGDER